MDKNSQLATDIAYYNLLKLRDIISAKLFYTEHNEDGSISLGKTEFAEKIEETIFNAAKEQLEKSK